MLKLLRVGIALTFIGLLVGLPANAAVLTSPNYRFDPSVANTFGGLGTSSHYGLTDSGGETAIANGTTNGSYTTSNGYVAQTVQSIQAGIQPNGILAYYPMDTNIGTRVYDVSANQNDGTMSGGVSWVGAQIGSGLSFNGTSGTVSIPNTSSVNPTTAYTMEGWVKPGGLAGASTNYNLMAKETYGSKLGYRMYIAGFGSGNALACGAGDGTTLTYSASSVLLTNTSHWYHVACTFGSGAIKTYVDGVATGSTATSVATISANANPLSIGSYSGSSEYYNGQMDEMKLYNRVLSPTEVANDYTAGLAGVSSAITIPSVTAGTPQSAAADVTVRTDAAGYNLAISQNHDLLNTDAVTIISPISAAIASPAAWAAGTTKGLGFTVTAASGLEAKWGSGSNYAAIPGSATTFHSKSGLTGGLPEVSALAFKLDVPASQKSGNYSNMVTITATLKP